MSVMVWSGYRVTKRPLFELLVVPEARSTQEVAIGVQFQRVRIALDFERESRT